MSDTTKIDRHFKNAIDYLDDNYAFFCTHILNMGRPHYSGLVPTACVLVPKDKDESEWEYHFSAEFAKRLNVQDFAFVMAHETMHILLRHLRLGEKFEHKKVFNIAADCVINDYLVNMGMSLPKQFVDGESLDLMSGEKCVQMDCANLTVSEVYDLLLKQAGDQGVDLDEFEKGSGYAFPGQSGDQIDDHEWIHDATFGQKEAAKNAADSAPTPAPLDQKAQDDDFRATSRAAGKGEGSALHDFVTKTKATLKWAELLKIVNPDVFKGKGLYRPKKSFHRPRRKLTGYYPDIMLPVERDDDRFKGRGSKRPLIVFALDTSGSVSRDDVLKAYELVQSIPEDKIQVRCCYFHTQYGDLDLSTPNPKYTSGGTDFSAIERFVTEKIEPEIGHYPKAVVVITDGYATFSREQQRFPDNWHWLINHGGEYTPYGQDVMKGKSHRLDDFVEL